MGNWAIMTPEQKATQVRLTKERRAADPHYRDMERARQRARYAASAEVRAKYAASRDRFRRENPAGQAWLSYRKNAKTRGIAFALPRALFLDLVTDVCFYCGYAPSPINGVDRVDNTRGYVEGNVVSCCRECNQSKRARTRADFESWAVRIARRVSA